MKKLILIICCLGIFFSNHAQDKPVGNFPIKGSDVAVPKGDAYEMVITPPKFVECNCSKYYVAIGKGDSAMVDMKNGSSVIFQDGQQLVVKKVLNCNSGVTGEINCSTCQQFQWKIIDESGMDLVAWSNGEVPPTIGKKMKCDVNYKLVLQGRCGCTLCPPFIVNLKKSCCNCNALSQNMTISGMNEMCLPKKCDQIFTYSVPALEPSSCFTYKWEIKNEMGVNVSLSGQSTNKITFSCKGLKVGNYSINLTIKCQDKTITLTKPLKLCETPNADFAFSGQKENYSANTTTPAALDYWILIEDINGDGLVSAGDVPYTPNGSTSPMDWTAGTSISFSDLKPDKTYILIHLSINACGGIFSFCAAAETTKYGYSTLKMMTKSGLTPYNIKELPMKLRKGLPKKVFETSSTNESIKD